jgi:glyoxylase-like metal-dependent hydrolase (beta-lactamase superfamily II)
MAHGIGVVNAYLVSGGGAGAILFDTGPGPEALASVWPCTVRRLEAIFITHVEPEHADGIRGALERLGPARVFIPSGASAPMAEPIGEAESFASGGLTVTAFLTPGHCARHNCYHVRSARVPSARSLLVSGDLIFAGSAGGPYHCQRQLRAHLRRVLAAVPPDTVVAPGHGPMTTAENELRYNPFVS